MSHNRVAYFLALSLLLSIDCFAADKTHSESSTNPPTLSVNSHTPATHNPHPLAREPERLDELEAPPERFREETASTDEDYAAFEARTNENPRAKLIHALVAAAQDAIDQRHGADSTKKLFALSDDEHLDEIGITHRDYTLRFAKKMIKNDAHNTYIAQLLNPSEETRKKHAEARATWQEENRRRETSEE